MVTKTKQTVIDSLFQACINLKWPETGNQDQALEFLLNHPRIRNKIDFEAKRLSRENDELDCDELTKEIESLLYLAIRNEFNLKLTPSKIGGWLCSRIAWRALDHVAKQCEFVYDPKSKENGYKRIKKTPILGVGDRDPDRNLRRDPASLSLLENMSFGDMNPASAELHPNFESFLRKSSIKSQHKHVLMYMVVMDYSFKELADIYQISSPTARKLYKQALASFKRYVLGLDPEEQQSLKNLLSGKRER